MSISMDKSKVVIDTTRATDQEIETIAYKLYYDANPQGDARFDLWPRMTKANREQKLALLEEQAANAGVVVEYEEDTVNG